MDCSSVQFCSAFSCSVPKTCFLLKIQKILPLSKINKYSLFCEFHIVFRTFTHSNQEPKTKILIFKGLYGLEYLWQFHTEHNHCDISSFLRSVLLIITEHRGPEAFLILFLVVITRSKSFIGASSKNNKFKRYVVKLQFISFL